MSRTAMMDPPPTYKGKSKIPKLDSMYHGVSGDRPKNGISANPTRLERMQVNYQKHLMQQKEERMIQLFEENQKKTLRRVNSFNNKPGARNFFQQRRNMMENGNADIVPLMNRNYQKREPQTSGAWTEEKPPVYKQQTYQNRHMGYKKMSAGRDKSNPLAPIERNNSTDSEISIPRKPQIFGRPRTKDSTAQEGRPMQQDFGPRSAPGTLIRRTPSKENVRNGLVNSSPSDDTPPPNLSQLKQKQKLKTQGHIKNGRPPRGPPPQTKPTDFEKWQMEQEQARADRLKKYQESVVHEKSYGGFGGDFEYEEEEEDDNVGNTERDMETEEEESRDMDNEIQRKQREIMAKIAAQQAELERIQQQRQEEEEEERREREKRKKREAERQRQHKLDEMRRRKEEEERERKEEEEELARIQKQLREERAREAQAREAQIKVQSHFDDQNDGYSDRMSHNSYHRDPVPPSKPKPANNYRARKKEPAARHVNRTSPVSMDAFDNTSLPAPSFDLKVFEQAAQQDGAYDNSVRLEACPKCGRKFASDRLQRHMNSCDNLTKKRKVMDPKKMRVAGTEFEKYNSSRAVRQKTPPKKSSNWKAKHESFINNIRYARKAKAAEMNGTLADLPPPPPEENLDYVQCRYCSRKFNPAVAERHIPRCKDIKARPAPVKRR